MNYKLNDISISSLNAFPAINGQAFALHGMFDLPKRIGTTEYDWGTSIEPFVEEEDIELDGRTLTLHVAVKLSSLESFKQACLECQELSTDYETYEVVQKDEITVVNMGEYYRVTVPFWQQTYIPGNKPINPIGIEAYRLDEFSLREDFGVIVAESNNMLNTAKRIDVSTSEFYGRTNFRGSRNISLNCAMKGENTAILIYNMKRFHALMMSPGMRTLVAPNKTQSVYFKNGLTATAVKKNVLQFTLIATHVEDL